MGAKVILHSTERGKITSVYPKLWLGLNFPDFYLESRWSCLSSGSGVKKPIYLQGIKVCVPAAAWLPFQLTLSCCRGLWGIGWSSWPWREMEGAGEVQVTVRGDTGESCSSSTAGSTLTGTPV